MSDIDNEYSDADKEGEGVMPPPLSDNEIPFPLHSDTPIERVYDKALHWVKRGVRPSRIFLADRSMGVISFQKAMRDPILLQAGVERMIDFRCSLSLSDTDIDVVFSSICYYEPGSEPTYLNDYDPEKKSINDVLSLVSKNLMAYLKKPLLRREPQV